MCGRCQAKSADNTGCCKGERRQWRKQRTEAGAAVAECEGLLSPKHDAGTATRHYRAFWQRRCRAAAVGAVLKPQGGNCAVLPYDKFRIKSRFKTPLSFKLWFPAANLKNICRGRCSHRPAGTHSPPNIPPQPSHHLKSQGRAFLHSPDFNLSSL